MSLRAILFDLDGTLVDSERQCAEAVARVLQGLGRTITQAERDFVIGHGWHEIYANLAPLPLTPTELIARAGQERDRIVDRDGLVVLPGAVELVREAARALRVSIVSGSSRAEVGAVLHRLGLDELVPRYVGSEDVAQGKPSPLGYRLGASLLGVEPSETLVIEDSAAGIAAGRAAGMTVVGVRAGNFANQDQSAAHRIVGSLTEIDLARLSALHDETHAGTR